jgi:xanthine dehydrogenase accessory factor
MHSGAQHLLKKYSFVKGGTGATGMSCGGEAEVFMEVYGSPKKLIIFGGGHIGRDLAKLAFGSEFQITVIDDRPDILSTHDKSVTTLQTDSEYLENSPPLDRNCYVVIVTRSHIIDQSILARVINEDYAYIGMIGSKAKVANVLKNLEQSGIDKKLLDKVHAPIGLDIKGEGPYEIAVSIMAEIIAEKNGIAQSKS